MRTSRDTNSVHVGIKHVCAMATRRNTVINQELQDNTLAFVRFGISKGDVLGHAHCVRNVSFKAVKAICSVTAVMPS